MGTTETEMVIENDIATAPCEANDYCTNQIEADTAMRTHLEELQQRQLALAFEYLL